MARPKKETVDYFPHFVNSGKTLYILESTFGNDGYAFWFKLLELLGHSDGHVYDCRNIPSWKFLLAKTRVDEDKAMDILNMLVELEAIDKELWQNKLIWSDNFVVNLTPVYSNRKSSLPEKPVITSRNNSTDEFLPVETEDKSIPTDENSQSKVKDSKVKNNIIPPISPKGESDSNSEESLLVETATGEPLKGSPSKTRKSRKKTELTKEQRITFDRFWGLWPKKVSKGQAEIAWAKLDPNEDFTDVIIAGVERAIKHDKRFDNGYIPHPATWLNAKGWLDEFNLKGGTADGQFSGNTGEQDSGVSKQYGTFI